MKSPFVLFILSFLLSISVKGQELIYGPTVSYQYQNGSVVKLGANVIREVGYNSLIRADVTANMSWIQNKFMVIPEVAFSYYIGNSNGTNLSMFFIRGEVTPYTVTPKLGFTVLTLIELDLGYGISVREKKDYLPMKGITASLRFSFPLNLD